jgi:hypothetical protein
MGLNSEIKLNISPSSNDLSIQMPPWRSWDRTNAFTDQHSSNSSLTLSSGDVPFDVEKREAGVAD